MRRRVQALPLRILNLKSSIFGPFRSRVPSAGPFLVLVLLSALAAATLPLLILYQILILLSRKIGADS